MKILPLAKIAAARKRLIERTKEINMPIDIEALSDDFFFQTSTTFCAS